MVAMRRALVSLLIASIVLAVSAHDCIHEDIVHQAHKEAPMPVTDVSYDHPFHPMEAGVDEAEHKLRTLQSWSNFRVHIDTSGLSGSGVCTYEGQTVSLNGRNHYCQRSDVLTQLKKNFIIYDLLPAAKQYITNALRVRQVSGRLTVNAYNNRCGTYNDYVTVPSSHRPGSSGVTADFILYVSAKPTTGSTIAWALTCARDSRDRPIAGLANFGPGQIKTSNADWDEQLSTAIHEIAHALGFSSSRFGDFRMPDGVTRRGKSNVVRQYSERGRTVSKIITPRVRSEVGKHFNCHSMNNPGMELEDHGGAGTAGSHWEKRMLRNEYMTGTSTSDPKYSAISLALFEDSGWYSPNYNYAERLEWGFQQGCSFAQSYCTNWDEKFFCKSRGGQGCTHDFMFKGYCNLVEYTSDLPSAVQYFTNPRLGGSDQHADFCPFVRPYSNGDCRVSANAPNQADAYGESYVSMSRCFESSLLSDRYSGSASERGRCYEHRCRTGSNGKPQLQFRIGSDWWICPQAGGVVTIPGFKGSITCPAALSHCLDGVDPSRRLHSCPGECTGRGTCVDGKCNCQAGYHGDDCAQVQCPNDCGRRGVCDSVTGKCTCPTPWTGDDCTERKCPADCNGEQGVCDTATGKCTCASGYTGSDCSTRTSSAPDQADSRKSCVNGCSGRGRCVEGVCQCAAPWNGTDCSERPCPGDCSGFGRCDRSTGQCACDLGRTGCDCAEDAAATLEHDVQVTQAIRAGEYHFYRMFSQAVEASLNVTAVGASTDTDVDIFISQNDLYPTRERHVWLSDAAISGSSGVETVALSSQDANMQPGMFYVSVYGATAGTYTIRAQLSCLVDGAVSYDCGTEVACMAGCSGRGRCDPATGACLCHSDAHEGAQCEQDRPLDDKNATGMYIGIGVACGVAAIVVVAIAVIMRKRGARRPQGGLAGQQPDIPLQQQ